MIYLCLVMFAVGLAFGLLHKTSTSTIENTLQCTAKGLEVVNIPLSSVCLASEIWQKEAEIRKIEQAQRIGARIEQMRADGLWARLVAACEACEESSKSNKTMSNKTMSNNTMDDLLEIGQVHRENRLS